jgi:Predicted oxidoreductases of the aldo/keto reductase family
MKKLGFGFMRLPLLNKDDQTSIDYEKLNQMVDQYMEKGFNYFDTAVVYHNGMSEIAFKNSVAKRYPRESFILADKMSAFVIKPGPDEKERQEKLFFEQLKNCGVEYFDYYLVHSLSVSNYKRARELDTFEFIKQKKEKGYIKHIGFSFHDSADLLDEILTNHPYVEFVQLQINYLDWDNESIQARKCYEIARKHGKDIMVMEPLKGGVLASLPKKAEELLKKYNSNMSAASWSIRHVASLEGVKMVLSGMNNIEVLQDNLSYMTDFKPLVLADLEKINQVIDIINESIAVSCTACRYCVEDCPKKIAIPEYFALYNNLKQLNSPEGFAAQSIYYRNISQKYGKASDCIGCKLCQRHCPQRLDIVKHLKEVATVFE